MYALKFTEGPLAGSYYLHRLGNVDEAFITAATLYPTCGHCRVYHLGSN